ncbi:MAG: amidohydrolase family protein [Sheuella sp.]|nr:amidohydrolase family protein [Sheuella sp.]
MTTILIQGGNVLDVVALTLKPADVLVENGKISQIGAGLKAPEGSQIINAKGLTVMPGMIDCHTHIVASQVNLGLNANLPNALATLRAVPILSGILMRGFTSVRDAGGANWSLAEATRTDIVDGPRIFPSGRALSQTGGHGDFRARSDIIEPCACSQRVGNISRVVDGEDNIRLAIREEIQMGASQIKIMASGGVASPNDPIHFLGYSEKEIRAAVEEATNAGTYVMAHAYTPRAISRAVQCGVRTIEHGNLVDESAANVMREHNAFMVPTLITYEALANEGATLGLPAESVAKIEGVRGAGKKALEILAKAGVKMGLGSDLLGAMHRHESQELKLRADILGCGMVLQQATLIGAEIIGMTDQLGVIRAGAIADLLLVDGNPLTDISCLLGQGDQIRTIIKDGKIYKH